MHAFHMESWLRFLVRKRTVPTRYIRVEIYVKFQTKPPCAPRNSGALSAAAATQTSRVEASRRDGSRRRGKNSCKETSDWLWQFKSCERGGGVATSGDLIAPRILAAARLESPRARASIISGKFQTGSRGLASAEAARKSVNAGGSFEKDPRPFPLSGWR